MRIINVQQKGLFHKKVEEVPLDKIEQVTYEIQGFWRSCFNIGNLRVKSRLQYEEICVMGIRNPVTRPDSDAFPASFSTISRSIRGSLDRNAH